MHPAGFEPTVPTSERYSYKHALRICNTYCLSTASVVMRKRLNVTLYIHWLSCSFPKQNLPFPLLPPPVSHSVGTMVFLRGRAAGRESNRPPTSSTDVQMSGAILLPPLYAAMAWTRKTTRLIILLPYSISIHGAYGNCNIFKIDDLNPESGSYILAITPKTEDKFIPIQTVSVVSFVRYPA